ncbi:DUF3883 domain-containing protein [Actinopolymorpha sp. B11F2]|uniref:DUF3883 domain-containing protein n=1 Tax=Actinopolymorpha sp. B11F2 TaxID=3160862 RepID=UPI0032E42580
MPSTQLIEMDVVAALREGELAPLRLQAGNALHASALKSLYERGAGQELVRQQYTGRYPFELLQNANDAAGDAGTRGRAYFHLTESALIVADDGAGFGDVQVNAICSLGRSSKGPGEAVGHKGLGFKSVGEITDRPQITSALTSFQFNDSWARDQVSEILGPLPPGQKLPVYAIPFPVEPSDFGPDEAVVEALRVDGFATVIRLPFRDGVDCGTVEEHLLLNLQPRLLLFLPHVDHLEVRGTSRDFSSRVFRSQQGGAEHVQLDTDGRSEEWFIYRGTTTPDPTVLEPLGAAWKRLEQVRFAVAVPVDGKGQPSPKETFPLHVYFPTDERPGLHVAVHAEWALTMDRRQVATTPEALPFNHMLTMAVAEFLSSTVAQDLVNRTGASAAAIQTLVPAACGPVGEGGTALRMRWTDALMSAAFLPSADGQLRLPAQIRSLPRSLPDLTTAHSLAALDLAHTLRPEIERLSTVRSFLADVPEIDEMGVSEFLSVLKPPTQDTAAAYYSFLVSWRDAVGYALLGDLKKFPIVLSLNGQLLAPGEETIFFPRERGEVALPDDLPVPIAYVPQVGGTQTLLRELGVKPFEWRELIRDFLIKILSDPEANDDARARAFAGLRAYHEVRLSGNEDLEPVLGRVLLPARTADGSVRAFRAAAEVYFGASWTGSDDLEVIYGPFGQAEFLDVDVPDDTDQRQNDLDFYRMLGVEAHPRLDEAKPTETSGYMVFGGRHPHRGPLFQEWMALPAVVEAARCPQGHPQSQQLKRSFRLDRHAELIDSQDPTRLMALWDQLARRWGSVYENGIHALFYCVHGSHAGERGRTAPSLFSHSLHSRKWVPVDHGNTAALVRPAEAWIEAAQIPRRIQERIPRISEAMYQTHGGAGLAAALHLTDAGRPRVADLLALLNSIADEAEAAGSTNREIDQAARWVQRTLHDVLRDEQEPHPEPQTVRLLASQDGNTHFVAQPPYADDPLLRDTFERRRPLLSAEAGLNKLTRYLSLIKLDEAVKTSALPLGEHHDSTYDAVRKRINAIKPYLLALVRAENSSAENRVRPALRNLELVVCDQLMLSYEYEGTQVARSDAVCYIASRQERRRGHIVNLGTAFLELDPSTNEPHWFPLGRQLAQHLNVPTLADAFTMLLTASLDDRKRMMAARQIQAHDITEARHILQIAPEDDEELTNILDSLVPEPTDDDQSEPSEVAALNQAAAATVTALIPEPGDEPTADDTEPPTAPDSRKQAPKGPPPVDYSSLHIVDAVPGAASQSAPNERSVRHSGGGGVSYAPGIQTEEENRRVGKRGEDVAFHAERRRLSELGKNPDSVHWVSTSNELSPYDITSVDEDDQRIYIEVKSTKGADPREPFYISHGELIEATYRRSRYYIYRVTDVDAEVPVVTRWKDPLTLIREGNGRLLLAKAQMALALENEADGSGTSRGPDYRADGPD